ncbi:MAG TPA: IS91 family transposase [Candidatus Saccharimonadales bacterium]|nr:IS91 family transposase [Candidatus Saccharimonadales bacterium]
MNRPTLEVADIFRTWGERFFQRSRARISWPQHKVMRAIERCRTAALGRHRDRCTRCGHDLGFSFNSCRNRHCPKCQTEARNRWVAARTRELVPLTYFHVVFTVPHELSELMLQNKRVLYELLFRSAAATLLEVAANPKHLGAEIGFMAVLHTWGQTLIHHPHIHCVVPAGGFAPGRTRWVHPKYARFFLPKVVLSEVFRGKFTDGLKHLFRQQKLEFHGSLAWLREPLSFARFLHTLHRHQWVVHPKKPFGGPEHVVHYLARYTHRVAISNHRLIGMQEGKVTFRWKDYAHNGKQRKMTLTAEEFIRRFLLHVLPKGLVRIRYYGWMANRCRQQSAELCRALLGAEEAAPTENGVPLSRQCPICGGPVAVVEMILPREFSRRRLSRRRELNSS